MNDTKGMKEMNTMISDFNKMVVFFVLFVSFVVYL